MLKMISPSVSRQMLVDSLRGGAREEDNLKVAPLCLGLVLCEMLCSFSTAIKIRSIS